MDNKAQSKRSEWQRVSTHLEDLVELLLLKVGILEVHSDFLALS